MDTMSANLTEIIYKTHWNQNTYYYDLDAHPVFSYGNGTRISFISLNNISYSIGTTGYGVAGSGAVLNPVVSTPCLAFITYWLIPSFAAINYYVTRLGSANFPASSASLLLSQGYPSNNVNLSSATSIAPTADIDGLPSYPAQVVIPPLPEKTDPQFFHNASPPINQNVWGEFNSYTNI